MPPDPLGSAAFAAGVGFANKRTTLQHFLDPPLCSSWYIHVGGVAHETNMTCTLWKQV